MVESVFFLGEIENCWLCPTDHRGRGYLLMETAPWERHLCRKKVEYLSCVKIQWRKIVSPRWGSCGNVVADATKIPALWA